MKRLGAFTECWYPLRDWTDEDISNYTLSNHILYDENRYDARVVSKEDKSLNSDYIQACMRCVDKREGDFVQCPKLQADIENISRFIRHEQQVHAYCNVRSGLPDMRGVLQSQVELADPQEGQVRCEWHPEGDATGGLSAT
jgi:3'-phosphoadenosine 5'-phosphosulfate sulfotransferase (PAPS reductase)/FAD synthetase